MSVYASDIVNSALQLIGKVGAGQTASAEDLADGYTRLNRLINSLATNRLTIYVVARNTYTLVSGTQVYTIGVGGTFNQARPLYLQGASVLDTSQVPTLELPITVLTVEQWQAIPVKATASALPTCVYYDYNWVAGLAQLSFWPVPNVGTLQTALYTPTALVEFADVNTTAYTFPPGYVEMLEYNLAVRLAPLFQLPLDPTLAGLASEAMANIKRANIRANDLRCDSALVGTASGQYNWISDTFGTVR